jgi:hypothetical protein
MPHSAYLARIFSLAQVTSFNRALFAFVHCLVWEIFEKALAAGVRWSISTLDAVTWAVVIGVFVVSSSTQESIISRRKLIGNFYFCRYFSHGKLRHRSHYHE